ncbi:hypothetical protein [Thioclava sp. GXIMD2076]|uniref:Uncharacterized protein n=1 Tax=Thioclava kandeliae TaxID=3070818 RepID=A0ABV1SEY7_9RHOB
MAQIVPILLHPAFWAVLCVAMIVLDAGLHLWMFRLGRQGRLQEMFDDLSRWQSKALHLGMQTAGKLIVLFGGCTAVALLHQVL